MKTTIKQQNNSHQKGILIALLLQMGIIIIASAQNPANVNLNDNRNLNISQLNNVYRNPGPNGLGGPNLINPSGTNVNVMDNNTQTQQQPLSSAINQSTGPNINRSQIVFHNPPKAPKPKTVTAPRIRPTKASGSVAINIPKSKPVVKRTTTARPAPVVAQTQSQRPVRRTTKPQAVSSSRPAHTSRGSNHRVNRVIQQTMPVQENTVVQQAEVIQTNNASVNPQFSNTISNLNTDNNVGSLSNLQAFTSSGNANVVPQMNFNDVPVVNSSEQSSNRRSVNAASISSGSSGKFSHHSSKSRRNSLSHFRYSTGKKFQRLFAKTKKNKFDPAKCFVWK